MARRAPLVLEVRLLDAEKKPCGCREETIARALAELFDVHSSEAECARIRATIAACPECYARMQVEEAARALLRSCCRREEVAPSGLRERITTRIRYTVRYEE